MQLSSSCPCTKHSKHDVTLDRSNIAQEENERLSEKVTNCETRIKELEQERSEHLTKIEQLSATSESVQKDQEELFILVFEQEDKLKEYTQKLVELGVKVIVGGDEVALQQSEMQYASVAQTSVYNIVFQVSDSDVDGDLTDGDDPPQEEHAT